MGHFQILPTPTAEEDVFAIYISKHGFGVLSRGIGKIISIIIYQKAPIDIGS
jgi:hypothetical protein